MNLARFGLRNEKTIVFVVAVLTVLGGWAYAVTPASIFPTMSFARIDVVAESGDLPPDQVRVAVAMPLERAFLGLPSATRVRATSSQGNAELIVEYDPHSNVQTDLQHVNEAISETRAALPPGTNVRAQIINPNQEPVISYALASDSISQTVLRELAQQTLVPQLYGTPGLARVFVVGGSDREFHVNLDPVSLSSHHLTAGDVSRALSDANTIAALGLHQQYYQRNVLILDAGVKTIEAVNRVTVPDGAHGAVPIAALGTVSLGVSPPFAQVSFDGRHAVILNFFGLPGEDAVRLADGVKARVAEIAGRLPVGVTLTRYWDQTDLIVDSQRSLRDAILLGAALAILVILVFLRNWRMTLVAAIEIPIAMSIAVFAIHQTGQTLNLMSVGGLAVAVGLIIDDAIVVIENIARNLRMHPELTKAEAIVLSMRELSAPMIASTITTVVVFIPLLLLTGVSGFFFRALALTLGSSLIVSLLLAIFLAPVLARWLIKPEQPHEETGFVANLLSRYEPLLRWSLDHRPTVYGLSAVVLLVTVVLLARLPSDFLPQLDEGQFEITYAMPVGSTLAATDAAATMIERIVLSDPAVLREGRLTGIDTNGFSPTQVRAGTIRIKLRPEGSRASYDAVSERLRSRIANVVPAAHLDFHQILEDIINDLSGAPAPVQITIAGLDQSTLVSLATKIAERISHVPGVTDAFSGVNYDDPTLRVAPFSQRLAALGISSGDLGSALNASAQGSVATSVAGPANLIPVRVTVGGSASNVGSTLVVTPSGVVPIESVATLKADRLSSDIVEENGQRVIVVSANINGASLSSAVQGIREQLAGVAFPPGYSAVIGGAYHAQQQSFREFLQVILIAVVLVFFVMLATFRSYRLPLVILTAIPLALIGVALGLFLTRTPFNVSSFMGLLLLVGIVVKNGILLIDVANARRQAGASVREALIVAGRTRLRPIVMTTFAAIGGLLPLAFGIGSGSAMERPLAIAVIGGLSTATAFTLVVIPVLYAGFAGKRENA
ncbi:MAG: efflux RND transporter permease subunit [Candidatus Eremiobacteraeota bacterium]|nr:efflux RND transporter permease subunit [Candidatus Eremiobacteraeota bacterium]